MLAGFKRSLSKIGKNSLDVIELNKTINFLLCDGTSGRN